MSHVRQNQRGCVGNSGGRCLSQGLLRFPAAASWDSSGLPVIISHNGTISRTPAISPCNQIYLSPKAEALLITQNLFPVFAVKQLPLASWAQLRVLPGFTDIKSNKQASTIQEETLGIHDSAWNGRSSAHDDKGKNSPSETVREGRRMGLN